MTPLPCLPGATVVSAATAAAAAAATGCEHDAGSGRVVAVQARCQRHFPGVRAAAAAAQRPVEVGDALGRGDGVRAVGRDDYPRERVVDAEAVQRRQQRVAATMREAAGNANAWAPTADNGVAISDGRHVSVGGNDAGAYFQRGNCVGGATEVEDGLSGIEVVRPDAERALFAASADKVDPRNRKEEGAIVQRLHVVVHQKRTKKKCKQ